MDKSTRKIYIIAIIFLALDQLTKIFVRTTLDLAKEISIIPNFFSFYYVENTGAAFSSFTGQTIFLILVSIFCLGLIIHLIQKEKNKTKLINISLGILLGGMIGNLIDRIIFQKVTDFLSFNIFGYRFPVFNVADIGITCGVALYLIISIINDLKETKK
ncbi:MAG: signal peptidase II [Bacilli bacterium]|nr:signal peptidase II [Bacilli bacterium]